jgi:alcohol dehydrogenase (cytochrome c)
MRWTTRRWTSLIAVAAVASVAGPMSGSLPAQSVSTADLLAGLTNPARWLTVHGDYSGQRHSPLAQITPSNANQLRTEWTFQTGITGQKFEATPLVVDGTLYVTGPQNVAWAIDGRTGRQVWRYQRTLPAQNEMRVCCGNVNRGLAVWHDRLFMTTLDAHLVALDIKTGKVIWDVEMASAQQGYSATAAPLVVNDKVIAGISGGEFAIRGFLDAYDAQSGRRVWRFWTVPAPGEPGSETWPADAWARGGGPTWVTGTFDPELNLVYWGVGNPNPDYNGADRNGSNLYTNAVVALDANTGKLRWHYQFTPHDEHDWDANQVPVLADLTMAGRPRKVMMVANRNGFFYVIDRANGAFVRASPFVRQTWAKEIASDGRPVELPDQRPTPSGTLTCPDLYGGTNFMSPSYDPATRLFYVTAREVCQIYISAAPPPAYVAGDRRMGGTTRAAPEPGWGALRAIDPLTGERTWEIRYAAPSWSGVLSTAGGVVFAGDNVGNLLAVDARTGRELWRAPLGASVYTAPSTYSLDGRQFVVIGAGPTLTAFALPR